MADTQNPFAKNISEFVRALSSQYRVVPGLVHGLNDARKGVNKTLLSFIDSHCTEHTRTSEGNLRTYNVPVAYASRHRYLRQLQDDIELTFERLPRMMLISMVSEYDAYLGRLIEVILRLKPEILNASAKQMSFSQIIAFANIEDAKTYVIEREVESVLRSSHSDQFDWLEKTASIQLRKGLAEWPAFIELTERRNLFVHCDGVISSQYIATCKTHKALASGDIQAGTRLWADPPYTKNAFAVLLQIGAKLGHTLWRKLWPEDRHSADSNLNELAFDLLVDNENDLAIELLEFAVNQKKHSSAEIKLYMQINLAQAYKWAKNEKRCASITRSIDWSPFQERFRLAESVLKDDFESALKYMKRIGANDETMTKAVYKDWPLFKRFRKHQGFAEAYAGAFGEPFRVEAQAGNEELFSAIAANNEESVSINEDAADSAAS